MTPDMVNGIFEALGAIFVSMNVVRLYRDKRVRGVHWASVAFFTSWGLWNVYFYHAIAQPFSWYAGVAVAVVNAIWLAQMGYYIRKEAR